MKILDGIQLDSNGIQAEVSKILENSGVIRPDMYFFPSPGVL